MRCTIEIFTSPTSQDYLTDRKSNELKNFTSPTSQDYLTDRICKGIEIFTSPNSEDYLADERNKTCVENFTSPTLRKDQRKKQQTPRPMSGGRVLTALSFENFKSPAGDRWTCKKRPKEKAANATSQEGTSADCLS